MTLKFGLRRVRLGVVRAQASDLEARLLGEGWTVRRGEDPGPSLDESSLDDPSDEPARRRKEKTTRSLKPPCNGRGGAEIRILRAIFFTEQAGSGIVMAIRHGRVCRSELSFGRKLVRSTQHDA